MRGISPNLPLVGRSDDAKGGVGVGLSLFDAGFAR